jgi:hypothetical protein
MDPECCKIAVCDLTGFDSTDKIREETERRVSQTTALILDSVEALNSTAAKVRVYLLSSEKDIRKQQQSKPSRKSGSGSNDLQEQKEEFLVLYAKIDSPANFDDSDKIEAKWTRTPIDSSKSHLRTVQETEASAGISSALSSPVNPSGRGFDFEINLLEPSTEYFIKVHEVRANVTSNAVVVRTFPHGIDTSFNGCFHGNKTYEVGQVFFDGCAYRCSCREGGIRECEERCPVYIDAIGYENCDWQPAPEDPCCTIPVCSVSANSSSLPPPISPSTEASTTEESSYSSVEPTTSASPHIAVTPALNISVKDKSEEPKSSPSISKNTSENNTSDKKSPSLTVEEKTMKGFHEDNKNRKDPAYRDLPVPPSPSRPYPPSQLPVLPAHFPGFLPPPRPSNSGYPPLPEYRPSPLPENPSSHHLPHPDHDGHSGYDEGPESGMQEAFCVSPITTDVYSVDQSWIERSPCLARICKCVLLPNETTDIVCEGGCADIPSLALRPSPECPRPHLVQPQDPCVCPYVICNNVRNPVSPPPKLPSSLPSHLNPQSNLHSNSPRQPPMFKTPMAPTIAAAPDSKDILDPKRHNLHISAPASVPPRQNVSPSKPPPTEARTPSSSPSKEPFPSNQTSGKMPQAPQTSQSPISNGCSLRGRRLPFGEEAYDDCRAVCHCGFDGKLNCGIIECPHHFGSETSECSEWESDPDFIPSPPECCPRLKCKVQHKPKEVEKNIIPKEPQVDSKGLSFSSKPIDRSCVFAGITFENFKIIPVELLPCPTKCVCVNGNITCENCDAMNEALASETKTTATTATTVQINHSLKAEELKPYYFALAIMGLFAAVTSIAFLSLLCIILRSKSSANALITRTPGSDQAYDNPSYKTCDSNEHYIHMSTRNGLNHEHLLLQNAVAHLNQRNASHHNNLNHNTNHHSNHHNRNSHTNMHDSSNHSNSSGVTTTNLNSNSSPPGQLSSQIKLNGLNGATIIGTAQV